MASIQQSLNQLLGATAGAATAGTYMYRQSPSYHAKQYDKEAKEVTNLLDSGATEFIEDTGEYHKKMVDLSKERVKATEQAYKTKPTVARHEASVFATKEYNERLKELKEYEAGLGETPKKKAEDNSLSRLQNTVEAQTEQKENFKDRLDMLREVLSAKELGQLDTMYNRHRKKGEID